MWPDHLDNPQAIYSAFPNRVPELKGLHAGRLLIHFPDGVFLGLEIWPLPDGCPSRWRERGKDRLEYRFMFYGTSDLSIVGTTQNLGASVTLELDKGAARLFSQARAFSTAFKFRGGRIYLHAFSARQRLDQQELWPPFPL